MCALCATFVNYEKKKATGKRHNIFVVFLCGGGHFNLSSKNKRENRRETGGGKIIIIMK